MVRERGWYRRTSRVVAASVVLATIVTACGGGGTGGQDEAGGDETAAPTTDTVQEDAASDAEFQIWADELLLAMSGHEEAISGIALARVPRDASPEVAVTVLIEQAASIGALATALPDAPVGDQLLASRYETFVDAYQVVAASSLAVAAGPDDGSPWAFGEAMATFAADRDRWVDACFDLQATLADLDLGVLGCVGLTGAEDLSQEAFDDMANEGTSILQMILEGTATSSAGERDAQTTYSECQADADEVQLDELDRYVASTSMLMIERDQGPAWVEVLVFADFTTAQMVESSLQVLFNGRKGCLAAFGPTAQPNAAVDVPPELETLQLGSGFGFRLTDFPNDLPPGYLEMAADATRNVVAIYTAVGDGEPWEDRFITELVGSATVAGSRPL